MGCSQQWTAQLHSDFLSLHSFSKQLPNLHDYVYVDRGLGLQAAWPVMRVLRRDDIWAVRCHRDACCATALDAFWLGDLFGEEER